ncbi:ABC transporter permease [Dysosmobacter sp. NSJ-60]|uniref:ABC transporter permease n=1 Tax=Pusillibacter faecalis TaxID=2714358 RepID=A0A810QNG9_9FIRM|nr:ABC transporter permease [Pusillibacter faecalis]MBC5747010.1 ABC transporter permease [Dysosmobacter hominis]MBS5658985.1 ABC transporter permease [Oscillibacter sp.]BCK85653.1 ABC transporter permease [Pusillibacter faecalis]
MNFTQSFKLALKSLRTSKMRAFLTMLGIIIGVGAVIVIISLGNGLTGMVQQQVDKLGVTQIYAYTWGMGDGTTSNITPDEMFAFVEEHPEAFDGITPWVSGGTGVRQGNTEFKKTNIYGVSEAMYRPETGTTLDGSTLARGRYLQYVDVAMRQNVCVIGAYLEINAFQGDALGKSLLIGGIPYTVVGVLAQNSDSLQEGGGDDAVYIPYQNAMQLSGTSYVSLYQITAASRDIVPSAQILLRDFLQDFYKDEDAWYNAYLVESMLDQVNMINAMMAVAMAVLVAIAAISLLVGGIGIMNIMLVSVTERTREIGIRKSLGAKRKDIRRQFIIEAGTTSAMGGILGILFGCLMAMGIGSLLGGMLISQMGVSGLTFNATPTFGAISVSFGVSVGIGVLFGYLPANKAAKLNPIDALRYE